MNEVASKHRILGLGTDRGINQPPRISGLHSHVCPAYTVTFVDLEEIRAFTLTISYRMVYVERSIIRHGLTGNRGEHHNPLFMGHVKFILEHSVANLCLDHK